MKHTIVLFLTIAAFLCGLPFSAQAVEVFFDDFDGVTLEPAVWRTTAQGASGLEQPVRLIHLKNAGMVLVVPCLLIAVVVHVVIH
jgi:hypothetical protein